MFFWLHWMLFRFKMLGLKDSDQFEALLEAIVARYPQRAVLPVFRLMIDPGAPLDRTHVAHAMLNKWNPEWAKDSAVEEQIPELISCSRLYCEDSRVPKFELIVCP